MNNGHWKVTDVSKICLFFLLSLLVHLYGKCQSLAHIIWLVELYHLLVLDNEVVAAPQRAFVLKILTFAYRALKVPAFWCLFGMMKG